MSRHPDHAVDLARSGLSDATIAALGIRSLAPHEWAQYLAPTLIPKIDSLLFFPYPGADDFYRVKPFPSVPDGDGHSIRYYQPARSSPRLYVPPATRAVLADPGVELAISEGEKKAAKADQDGLRTVGLGGVWSWRHRGRPIADLDLIDFWERSTLLVPDSDVFVRPDLLQSVFALGKECEVRGAVVHVLKLPAGPNGAKVGLDDFLVSHSLHDLHALPRLALTARGFARTASWWRGWTKRQGAHEQAAEDARTILAKAGTVRTLHPAQDVHEGVLFYGVQVDEELLCLASTRKLCRADELPETVRLRHTRPGRSSVTRETAVAWIDGAATGSVQRALDALALFFHEHVVLRDRSTSTPSPMAFVLGAWVLASWTYRCFRIFPYLVFRSSEKRSGKSRALGLVSRLAFGTGRVQARPTEAGLYRGAERSGGTQCFDEVETRRGKTSEQTDALLSVLNVGFESGSTVSRLEKRGEAFVEVDYDAYCPRALAGLRSLEDTLEDRSLFVFMVRRLKNHPGEQVKKLGRQTEEVVQRLRAECAWACLEHIGVILAAVEQVDALLQKREYADFDDRLVDLWRPLLAMALVADVEQEPAGTRHRVLLDVMRAAGEARDADTAGGSTATLVQALLKIREKGPAELAPGDLLEKVKAELPSWEWLKSTKRLAGLLGPLGLVCRQQRTGARRRRVYALSLDLLKDLEARYGGGEDEEAPA